MSEQEKKVKNITLDDAFKNIDRACSVFQGTRADHVLLQTSLRELGKLVAEKVAQPAEEPPEEDLLQE